MSSIMADTIGNVYLHHVLSSWSFLADEIDKWRFLKAVQGIQQKHKWQIYAFCLVDQGAYFITESEYISDIQNELGRISKYICDTAVNASHSKACELPYFFQERTELASMEALAGTCRALHYLPVERGCAQRIGDYWWSSYNSYIGVYQWGIVNCIPISMYFSEEPEEAQHMIKRYHLKRHTTFQKLSLASSE